jgi:hypothetical protein
MAPEVSQFPPARRVTPPEKAIAEIRLSSKDFKDDTEHLVQRDFPAVGNDEDA